MEVVLELQAASGEGSSCMAWTNVLRGTIFAIGLGLGLAGCGVSFAPLPAPAVAGRIGNYDYSPSVIQSGDLEQIWWCGSDYNPTGRTQFSDTIQYESIDLSTNARYGPVPVMAETQGAWDSVYTCNPKVVRGSFANPLGNGETFTYAMYYVATGFDSGTDNSIGVAFSNDGLSWKKYPQPIISPATQINFFGVGQPAVFNNDQHEAIRVFYENCCTYVSHVETISSDGVHFKTLGTLTTNGLVSDNLTWGDMAYDPGSGYWYAAFHAGLRDISTTGGIPERGQYGIQLYRIQDASLLTGSTPWELLTNIDTNLTGYESNFLPGFVRDMYGNLISGPAIQMLPSISDPPPAWNASPAAAAISGDIAYWKISTFAWTPNPPPSPLNRYFNQTVHEVTTGWIDPNGGFSLQSTLGHLYQSPQQGATVPFYGCKSGSMDYFVSLDGGCEGARILGMNGYGYSAPVAGLNLVALYRCKTSTDHFVSTDPKCEGSLSQGLLGYALP
jgi:hypothetical protein